MRLITPTNLTALMMTATTPYFIHGEYHFYALICFLGGISLFRQYQLKARRLRL